MSGAYSQAFSSSYDIGTPAPPPVTRPMGGGGRRWPVETVRWQMPPRPVPEPRRFNPPLVVQHFATLVPTDTKHTKPPRVSPRSIQQDDEDFIEAYLLGE